MPAIPGLTIAETARQMVTVLAAIRRGAAPEGCEAVSADLKRRAGCQMDRRCDVRRR